MTTRSAPLMMNVPRSRHDGEVAEEEALFLDLAGLLDAEFDVDEEGRGVGHVAFATFFFGVLWVREVRIRRR